MARPVKTEQIPHLREAIKAAAWKMIATSGAPALSLRAIARELGISAPAIYNYFVDRDALVTALTIDAFLSFGDCQIDARDSFLRERTIERLEAIGIAYRKWARSYPQRYQLIFGTPIPGYEMQGMEIRPAAARSISALVSVVDDLRLAGRLNTENFPEVKPGYEEQFQAWKSCCGDVHILALSVSILLWSRLHGLVSLGVDAEALYRFELESCAKQFIREL
jgi:AcrR family transcriptional regulator